MPVEQVSVFIFRCRKPYAEWYPNLPVNLYFGQFPTRIEGYVKHTGRYIIVCRREDFLAFADSYGEVLSYEDFDWSRFVRASPFQRNNAIYCSGFSKKQSDEEIKKYLYSMYEKFLKEENCAFVFFERKNSKSVLVSFKSVSPFFINICKIITNNHIFHFGNEQHFIDCQWPRASKNEKIVSNISFNYRRRPIENRA